MPIVNRQWSTRLASNRRRTASHTKRQSLREKNSEKLTLKMQTCLLEWCKFWIGGAIESKDFWRFHQLPWRWHRKVRKYGAKKIEMQIFWNQRGIWIIRLRTLTSTLGSHLFPLSAVTIQILTKLHPNIIRKSTSDQLATQLKRTLTARPTMPVSSVAKIW